MRKKERETKRTGIQRILQEGESPILGVPFCLDPQKWRWVNLFSPGTGPRDLVLGSIYQGFLLGTYFDPPPFGFGPFEGDFVFGDLPEILGSLHAY